MVDRRSQPLIEALALVASGTPLREALDRILQAQRGALIVIGDDPAVLSICTGGFLLDAEFTPQRLSELAKMDGAIILAPDVSRIARANVHLVPKASIPTTETGTRHRTAERVARSLSVPVVTVSEAMATIAVYRHGHKHTIPASGWLVDRSSQALSTMQRFKTRHDVALAALSTLEVEDSVSVRDVVAVLQPAEMALRIADEIEDYLVELGDDGRLVRLQLEELLGDADEILRLVMRDFVLADRALGVGGMVRQSASGGRPGGVSRPAVKTPASRADGRRPPGAVNATTGSENHERRADVALEALHALSSEEILDPLAVASTLGFPTSSAEVLDVGLESRGYRALHRLPRVSDLLIDRIVDRFGTLPRIMQASLGDLEQVGGVGGTKARSVKDGLARMVEASILERYE